MTTFIPQLDKPALVRARTSWAYPGPTVRTVTAIAPVDPAADANQVAPSYAAFVSVWQSAGSRLE